MTTENTTPTAETTSPRIERAAENLLSIGKLWATHGIDIGLSALKASGESLRLAAETLADVKSRLKDEPTAKPAA